MKFYSFGSLDPEKIDCCSQQTKQTGIDGYIIAMIAGVSRIRVSLMADVWVGSWCHELGIE